MSHEVYADGWEIAGKSGMNKSISRFPDVCLSPPSPPAGPIPVPYPDTSFSSDLKEGSQTVKLGGQPAALAQQSYYKPSVLGDEAATRAFGMNILSHTITGKTYFRAWSMDVKIEGKNVCRHLDITTSNHACDPTTTAPVVTTEAQTLAKIIAGKCPCCNEPLHENQKGDDGKALPVINEADYYKGKADFYRNRADELKDPKWSMLESTPLNEKKAKVVAEIGKFLAPGDKKTTASMIRAKARYYDDVEKRLAALRAANPTCPNVHQPEDVGCGAHFLHPSNDEQKKNPRTVTKPDGKGGTISVTDTLAGHAEREFSPGKRNASIAQWERKLAEKGLPSDIPQGDKVNHKTPKEAGGCNSPGNLVPDTAIARMGGPDCEEIEKLQTELTNSGE